MPSRFMRANYHQMLAFLILCMCTIVAAAVQGLVYDSCTDTEKAPYQIDEAPDQIEKASEQIEDGMTYDEVVRILGRDADYRWTQEEEAFYSWLCRAGHLTVRFEDGRATYYGITRMQRDSTGP